MARIKSDEIACYELDGGETVCTDCVTEEEMEEAKFDEIVTQDTIDNNDDDELVFCDRCKERILTTAEQRAFIIKQKQSA